MGIVNIAKFDGAKGSHLLFPDIMPFDVNFVKVIDNVIAHPV